MTVETERRKRSKSNKNVISKDGRFLGLRHVLYCPKTRTYVRGDCMGETPSRVWAWSGTPAQARRAADAFGIEDRFVLYLDGEEAAGV